MTPDPTYGDLLVELQRIRAAIEETNRALQGKAGRAALRLVALSVVLSLIVGISGVVYAYRQNLVSCRSSNEGRAQIRDLSHDAMTESAEGLITVAGGDAEPGVVDRYRAETQRRADAIVAQLEDRDC